MASTSRHLARCALAVLALTAGCAGNLPEVTSELVARAQAQDPTVTADDLHEGRRLYVQKCAGCHTLAAPDAHSPAEWPSVLGRMGERAKIDEAERDRIGRFLVAAAAAPDALTPAPPP